MNRRRFACAAAMALAMPSLARARTDSRASRVVIIPAASLAERYRGRTVEWFAEEGWVEGGNVALEYVDLWAVSGDDREVERRLRAIVDGRPEAILVPGSDFVRRLRLLTQEIPIVFYSFGLDPVRWNFVASLRRPGANVTGTTLWQEEGGMKDWEILKELRSGARRIGVLWDEGELADLEPFVAAVREMQLAGADRLGLERVEIVVPSKKGFASVQRAIANARVDVAAVFVDHALSWIEDLMRFFESSRIPAMWPGASFVRRGGLVASHPSVDQACRQAVALVARVLRSESPATIPVQQATHFITAINLRTARAMGLAVPPAVLVRASLVVE